MKKIKLTESDLTRIVRRVIKEQSMDKPTDDESLFHFLGRYTDLGNEERKWMARIFKSIQNEDVDIDKGIHDFNKKYPNATVPASLILTLL
jgi:hypothetical protein